MLDFTIRVSHTPADKGVIFQAWVCLNDGTATIGYVKVTKILRPSESALRSVVYSIEHGNSNLMEKDRLIDAETCVINRALGYASSIGLSYKPET